VPETAEPMDPTQPPPALDPSRGTAETLAASGGSGPRVSVAAVSQHGRDGAAVPVGALAVTAGDASSGGAEVVPADIGGLELRALNAYYGTFRAVRDVSLRIRPRSITALIGPSGCGKSTLLRAINRMHETIPKARIEGSILLDDVDLYRPDVSAVRVRRTIGMVFQKPNPFPAMSIYDNVASGLKLAGERKRSVLDGRVEDSLRRSALWDEVKDKLKQPGTSLSGGQQQRLCIARTIAVEPEVILMDEPCSALDPVSTLRIEELMHELEDTYTIVIVTHNMQQAARVSDVTAFFSMGEDRAGYLVEADDTARIFSAPKDPLTEAYVSGRFG
jgi:phosphate transport system ATP-binding protein